MTFKEKVPKQKKFITVNLMSYDTGTFKIKFRHTTSTTTILKDTLFLCIGKHNSRKRSNANLLDYLKNI